MKLRTAFFFLLDGFLFAIWLAALLLNFAAVALVTFAGWLLYQDGHAWAALLCAVGIVVMLVGGYEDLWKDRHIFGEWRRA